MRVWITPLAKYLIINYNINERRNKKTKNRGFKFNEAREVYDEKLLEL